MKVDVIAPLEAAHVLDDDDDVWRRRVAQALVPVVDDGRGTFAWTTHLEDRSKLDLLCCDALDPRQLEAFHGLRTQLARADYRRFHEWPARAVSVLAAVGATWCAESPLWRRWVLSRGIVDAGCFNLTVASETFTVGGVLRDAGRLPEEARRFGRQIATSLRSALRLRHSLRSDAAEVAAVFTSDARLLDARGAARSRAPREQLRDAVLARDKARTRLRTSSPDEALVLFDGLLHGRFTLVDRFERDGRRYVVAYENASLDARKRLTLREREILRRAALGQPIKRIACELGVSPGTAGAYFSRARRKTGIRSREELVRWFHGAAERMARGAAGSHEP